MSEQYVPIVLTRSQVLYVQKWVGRAVAANMDTVEANLGVEVISELMTALMRSDIEAIGTTTEGDGHE